MQVIKSSTEISEIFSKGVWYKTPYFALIVKQSNENEAQGISCQHDPQGRVAFIAGKKLGNAVWRNKAKRRMRAVCRDLHGSWDNLDVVFLARKHACDGSYEKMLLAGKSLLPNLQKVPKGKD